VTADANGEPPPDRVVTTRDQRSREHESPTLVGLVTAGAGIVGYVYAMGAASLYLELWVAGLPKGEALDQFTSRRFLLIGVVVTAGAAALTALLAFVIRALGPDPAESVEGARLLGRVASRFRRRATWQQSLTLAAVGTVLAWLLVNTLIIDLSLRLASVRTGSGCLSGIYISSDAEGVHLADGVSDSLLVIPASQIKAISIGAKRTVSGQSIRPCNAAESAATNLAGLSRATTPGG
jgi:hypothetical protein